MQSLTCSLAVATIIVMLPSIGTADDRWISSNEPLACNSLCRWWMAQGKPTVVADRPVRDQQVDVPGRTAPKRRMAMVEALLQKPALKRQASAEHRLAKHLIASLPTSALGRPVAALPSREPALPVMDATTALAPSPVAPSSAVVSADYSTASLPLATLSRPSSRSGVNIEPDLAREQSKPVQSIEPATSAPIDRPIRTLSGRIEAASVVACMLAMMVSFRRRSLILRWDAPRVA